MTGLVLAILFGLICLLFPSEGQISLPPEGDTFIVLPGENVTIAWKLDVNVSDLLGRSWKFLPKYSDTFAHIIGNGDVVKSPQYSPGPFTIAKPSTLIFKNVTIQYNGTYSFLASTLGASKDSEVTVFVAVEPNVTLSCFSPTILNEGDDFTCKCTEQGGKPSANLTWYKDGKQTGNTSYGKNRLPLTDVNKNDNGIYTCKAQSYTLKDEKSFEVKVRLNFKPNNTTLRPNTAVVGTSVVVTCYSKGLPEPSYTITRNGTVVSRSKTYTISEVKWSDNGTCAYECIASNKLGNDSACSNLTVEPKPPTTSPTTRPPTTTSGKTPSPSGSTKTTKKPPVPPCCPWWAILLMVIAAVVVLVIIAWLIHYCKKKEKDGYSGNGGVSPDGSGGVDVNHYELDGEPAGGVANTYDTANPSGASGSKRKPPKNTLPPVYAAVDKSKKDGKQLYATLDTVALHSDNSKKKRDEERPGQSEYASIDFGKIGKADEE